MSDNVFNSKHKRNGNSFVYCTVMEKKKKENIKHFSQARKTGVILYNTF